jgi:hypothetical protein
LRERSDKDDILPIKGGENKEIIMLTINCFKKFCMKASTKEADKIYDYYIKMEEIIFKYIQDQYKNQNEIIIEKDKILELKDQLLDEKDKIIEEKDKFIQTNFNAYNNLKYEEIEKLEHLYIFSTDIDDVVKIGETKKDVKQRKDSLQTACVKDIEIIYDYLTSNKIILEAIVHDILEYYRSKRKREHFRYN